MDWSGAISRAEIISKESSNSLQSDHYFQWFLSTKRSKQKVRAAAALLPFQFSIHFFQDLKGVIQRNVFLKPSIEHEYTRLMGKIGLEFAEGCV